jgi:3',5'-cyclic AMP phosphodiesterase CpdA
MFRVAHISDPHVLSPGGVEWRALLFNKRITGYLNLIRRRGRVSRRAYLDIVLEAAPREADHLVVTGDITNLALEGEFVEARSLLDQVARRVDLTVVPGNHDMYLPSLVRRRRFPHHFGHFLRSDLPHLSLDLPAGRYPCVKLRGPVAIIALSSGVPGPPFVSSGYLGPEQLAAFEAVLAHPEVTRRTPVILVHHPPLDRRARLARRLDGLVDAAAFRRSLGDLARGLVLFGHLHRRVRYRLPTAAGALDIVGASGAALDHPDRSVRAGLNRYDIGADGAVERIEALVLDPAGGALQPMPMPVQPASP